MSAVLDSSVLLAIAFGEAGAERAEAALGGAVISAVNASEVIARFMDRGVSEEEARLTLDEFEIDVLGFDAGQALDAGFLRTATRARGLSLGDRACLALARREGRRVLTADRSWAGLDLGVEIEVIR